MYKGGQKLRRLTHVLPNINKTSEVQSNEIIIFKQIQGGLSVGKYRRQNNIMSWFFQN